MEIAATAFGIAWVVGIPVYLLVLRATRKLGRVVRIVLSSFVFALFFAPALVGGHGITLFPAISAPLMFPPHGGLLSPREAVMVSLFYIIAVWACTALVWLVVGAKEPKPAQNGDAV